MNVRETQFPEAMTVEAMRLLEQASVQMLGALRRAALREQAQDAGAVEYDSWAGALEYDSWWSNFHRQ